MNERIDPDYDPRSRDVEEVVRLAAAAASRIGSIHVSNGNGFNKWMLGAALLLFVAGVSAVVGVGFSVVQRLSAVETKVDFLLKKP